MRFETISTGDEIVRGRSRDTNGPWLARRAAEEGVLRRRHTDVGDDPEALADAFAAAGTRADFVVVTGGLGPTEDDHTRVAAAKAAGVGLVSDADLEATIFERYRARGVPVRESSLRQALLPAGAHPLGNPVGTAPGFSLPVGRALLYCLPGVPHEMEAMYESHVRPALVERRGPGVEGAYRSLATFGRPEAAVNDLIGDLMRAKEPSVGVTADFGIIRVTVQATGSGAAARAEATEAEVRQRLGDLVLPARTLEEAVALELGRRGLTLATAESCTGGLVGALLTRVPGISAHYVGGGVTYSDRLKTDLLGVPGALIEAKGAVSEEVARAMAEGARRRFEVDLAVALTGVAGPGGGSPVKPVGLVWIALAGPRGTEAVERRFLPDREFVRRLAAHTALDLVRLRVGSP
ncbi:MAG: CinA family nicotinamide mononucleotide deamidase-related protein [Planctomycetes bacterium]|nr:CinA family nicotinamide mononucleotide deamidase-related protein [Planctomycetota bacterium]